jgi:hypothetical protein
MVDTDYLRKGLGWLSGKKCNEAVDTVGKAAVARAGADNCKIV